MRKFLVVVASLGWAVALFFVMFWLTFPSGTLANRIRYEIPQRLGRDWSADVDSVSPWFAGLSVDGIKLYRETTDDEGVTSPQLAALFEDASARLAWKSIFRGAPYLKGRVVFPEGDQVWWEFGTAMEGGKGARIADLVLSSDALPIGDLLAFAGLPSSITGTAAMNVDLHGGDNGMREAAGSIALDGTNLVVSDLEIPGVGPLGMEIPISLLAIHAAVDKGRATIEEGRIVSEMLTIEVKGDVTLRDPLDRSSVDLEIVLSNLGDQLSAFEGFMGDAKGADGNYHFHCRGVAARMSAESCTSGDDRRSSRPSARLPSTSSSSGSESEEDRARNRQEIQDRVAKRRAEREARRNGSVSPVPAEVAPVEGEDDEEPVEDLPLEEQHEPTDEDLGPDDEEPVE